MFGVDDAKWGEAVHAAVELHYGAAASADDIISFVKQHLDSVKAPKMVYNQRTAKKRGWQNIAACG